MKWEEVRWEEVKGPGHGRNRLQPGGYVRCNRKKIRAVLFRGGCCRLGGGGQSIKGRDQKDVGEEGSEKGEEGRTLCPGRRRGRLRCNRQARREERRESTVQKKRRKAVLGGETRGTKERLRNLSANGNKPSPIRSGVRNSNRGQRVKRAIEGERGTGKAASLYEKE